MSDQEKETQEVDLQMKISTQQEKIQKDMLSPIKEIKEAEVRLERKIADGVRSQEKSNDEEDEDIKSDFCFFNFLAET